MTIDENTGLPALPEGYFWNVRKDLEGDYHVTIRRGWHYLLSYKVQGSFIIRRPLTKESLSEKAKYVYGKWQDRVRVRESDDSLTGSYPPKSLNKKG
jgi:hypothetical protein